MVHILFTKTLTVLPHVKNGKILSDEKEYFDYWFAARNKRSFDGSDEPI